MERTPLVLAAGRLVLGAPIRETVLRQYGARPGVTWQPRPDSLLWLHGASIAG